jgi:hypothetical protein
MIELELSELPAPTVVVKQALKLRRKLRSLYLSGFQCFIPFR